ncbi:hypothetical protein HZA39_04795 [Candidatus Peregrinibacteria bacterium]|nr:hypothetical protein [Candidatus Peregrinibacteria bacterium]
METQDTQQEKLIKLKDTTIAAQIVKAFKINPELRVDVFYQHNNELVKYPLLYSNGELSIQISEKPLHKIILSSELWNNVSIDAETHKNILNVIEESEQKQVRDINKDCRDSWYEIALALQNPRPEENLPKNKIPHQKEIEEFFEKISNYEFDVDQINSTEICVKCRGKSEADAKLFEEIIKKLPLKNPYEKGVYIAIDTKKNPELFKNIAHTILLKVKKIVLFTFMGYVDSLLKKNITIDIGIDSDVYLCIRFKRC